MTIALGINIFENLRNIASWEIKKYMNICPDEEVATALLGASKLLQAVSSTYKQHNIRKLYIWILIQYMFTHIHIIIYHNMYKMLRAWQQKFRHAAKLRVCQRYCRARFHHVAGPEPRATLNAPIRINSFTHYFIS